MSLRWFAVLSLALGACSSAPQFVRIHDAQLEVAWVELEPPPGRPPVVLMNMVHLGEAAYFDAIQAELDKAPVVLMEGVIRRPQPAAEAGPRIGGKLFDLATTVRLVHQVDRLRMREHFRAVDLREDEFRSLASPPRRDTGGRRVTADLTRRTFAEWMVERHAARHPLPAVMHVRHRRVLAHLDALPAGQEVVLCWGYAHGRSFLEALATRGYRVKATSWRSVFGW